MKNIILLDLDGVLITTPPWQADQIHEDGYSDFNRNLVENLNKLLSLTIAEIWLSSSRRAAKSLEEFNIIFKERGVIKPINGFLPNTSAFESRINAINNFLDEVSPRNFIIIDDDRSLQGLSSDRKQFWIQTSPLIGFDKIKLNESLERLKKWSFDS